MSDEKKYSIISTVKIGTDEYRDLIEGKLEAENDRDEYRSKFWKEEEKSGALEKKVAAQDKTIARLKKFISLSDERAADYNAFMASIVEEENA